MKKIQSRKKKDVIENTKELQQQNEWFFKLINVLYTQEPMHVWTDGW